MRYPTGTGFTPCGSHCPTIVRCTARFQCQASIATAGLSDTNTDYKAAYDKACARIVELEAREQSIVYAVSYDWQQIYINGEQSVRGHTIKPDELMDTLGIKYRKIRYTDDEVDDGDNVFPSEITEAEILTHLED